MEDCHRSHHSNHRNHVDINARLDRPQRLDREIPGDKAQGRCAQSQKENVEQVHRVCKPCQFQLEIEQEQRREHKQDAIEEYSPGGKNGVIAVGADFLCQYRIAGPNQRSQQRQQVPGGVQFELGAVEADKSNPGHCDYKANEKTGMGLFFFQQQVGQDCREKRGYGDNHPDIGGHCVSERDIFQQIVKAYPA